MENKYKTLVALFGAISLISILGFYATYFQFFPLFEGIPFFTHIHFIIFLSWFAILIWQPILIHQRNYSLHRKVGRFSYFLAPVMVVSILVMVKLSVGKNLSISRVQAGMAMAGALLDVTSFCIFYVYSIVNKNRIRKHVAGMIGASLIILNPGLGRLIATLFNQELGILVMSLTPFLVSLVILLYEKFQLKRPMLKSPYLLIPLVWLVELVLFIVLPGTAFWSALIDTIAEV
ncbi:hypothetical protein ACI6PS_00225 [Flavobacterium sp. PLA-1-15]|uniref:hypothetical protein n=1 Tax=Flavobacterium sp. PLA-1-15 TaxID=3380533 RepID=UPI003B7750AE